MKYYRNDLINSIDNPKYKPLLPKIKHYALLRHINGDEKYLKLKNELTDIKIIPIEYKENIEWLSYFGNIRKIRETPVLKKVLIKGGRRNV